MSYILKPYDDSLEQILTKGIRRTTRTGIDTLSLFGMNPRYDISNYFPIITKRKIYPKSIIAEANWMFSGSTNTYDLNKLGSKIWDFWKDKDFEKRNGYEDGDLGPTYGHCMTNYGGDYKKNNGFNQIQYLIDELKKDKNSRRALINLWDPRVMTTDKVRLPCCHYTFQVLIDDKNRLTGILGQRSADYPIGVPANILFYSAFIYMIAQQLGDEFTPYELVHNTADSHIYLDQVKAIEEYLSRSEIKSPTLKLNKAKDIFSYKVEDFVIENYNPAPLIKIPVAI